MNMQQRRLNGWRRLALMPLLLLAVLMLVLAGSLELRGTAHAQTGSTITVASPGHLIARTTVQISVTVTCNIPEVSHFFDALADVRISQASGRQIVQADGSFFLTTCDGTAQTFQLAVTPPAGSAPFHGGPAIATSTLSATWDDTSGTFHEFEVVAASTQTISIKG